MFTLVKMNLKLLLRNKGFLFFLIVTPIISTFILSIKTEHSIYVDNLDKKVVLELKDYKEKAVYVGDTSSCIIKVYDDSNSKLSEYVLNQMAGMDMYSICRADVSGLTEKEIDDAANRDAFDDRVGMILYLKADFDKAVLSGDWINGMKLYGVSEDERQELFISDISEEFTKIKKIQASKGDDIEVIIDTLTEMQNMLPEKKVVNFAGKETIELTETQTNQYTNIGYAFAIITLGFLFGGVCVAHSVIEEQSNRVFTRITLTKVKLRDYFASKFVLVLMISVMQTLVLGICLCLIPGLDMGMSIISFLVIIFLLGLILSTLSLLIGVIVGDVMSSNYATFTVWSVSALLAGLYFPLDATTKALKTLSYLMPQRWFMDATKLLIVGDKSAFSMILCVTVAYLIVIISVGSVGLKIKRYE